MTSTTVAIQTQQGTKNVAILAEDGDLCLIRHLGVWSITHKETGLRIIWLVDSDLAEEALRTLASAGDWSRGSEALRPIVAPLLLNFRDRDVALCADWHEDSEEL